MELAGVLNSSILASIRAVSCNGGHYSNGLTSAYFTRIKNGHSRLTIATFANHSMSSCSFTTVNDSGDRAESSFDD